ncbi:MAG: phage holin family protein [Chloroflexota bacterium]
MDPSQDPATAGDASASPDAEPVGLRAQIGAVRDAVKRLVGAHLELAKAEASEIGSEIGRVALLGGTAFGAVLLVAILLPLGGILFLSEWLLGSLGWGVLLGTVALLDIAFMAILIALGVSGGRLGRDFLVALLAALAITIVLLLLHVDSRVSTGLGFLILLGAWPTLAGLGVSRAGIDTDALKRRFYPSQTIETTKETIEWVRERTPLGPKS